MLFATSDQSVKLGFEIPPEQQEKLVETFFSNPIWDVFFFLIFVFVLINILRLLAVDKMISNAFVGWLRGTRVMTSIREHRQRVNAREDEIMGRDGRENRGRRNRRERGSRDSRFVDDNYPVAPLAPSMAQVVPMGVVRAVGTAGHDLTPIFTGAEWELYKKFTRVLPRGYFVLAKLRAGDIVSGAGDCVLDFVVIRYSTMVPVIVCPTYHPVDADTNQILRSLGIMVAYCGRNWETVTEDELRLYLESIFSGIVAGLR